MSHWQDLRKISEVEFLELLAQYRAAHRYDKDYNELQLAVFQYVLDGENQGLWGDRKRLTEEEKEMYYALQETALDHDIWRLAQDETS